jgi:chemotaxis signal transduction protein
MESYLLFHVGELKYAIPLDKVHRISVVPMLTANSDSTSLIDGMFTFEDEVLNVISFRTLINLENYNTKIQTMFVELKKQHKAWLDTLSHAVHNDVAFSKTTNPHACHLGKWIDNFSSYDEGVMLTLKNLSSHHKKLHHSALDVLEKYSVDKDSAIEWVDTHVQEIYKNTISYLDKMALEFEQIANDSQKMLIIEEKTEDGVERFGVKVDKVDDIIHIESSCIKTDAHLKSKEKNLNIGGILEYKNTLNSIIESIRLEK